MSLLTTKLNNSPYIMWLRLLIIFLLLALLGILQTSFLVHFNIMGSIPNLIFILYFLVVFFEEPQKYIQGIFSAIVAGFFLDVFSLSYFGASIIYLLIITFVLKHILFLLRKTENKYPIAYFTPLFVLSFIVYSLLFTSVINFWIFLIEIIYNLVFAFFGFYIYKRFKLYEFSK